MALWRVVALIIIAMTAFTGVARAVDPGHAISQYGHRIWRVGEAGLTAQPTSFAQTSDGQLWVGTTNGLFRFDGKQFSVWIPPKGAPNFGYIETLLGASNGDLYIASRTGVYRISNGHYFQYPKMLDEPGEFIEDGSGTAWLTDLNYRSGPGLCSVGRTALQCYGPHEGLSCSGNWGLAFGEDHELWVGGNSGICRWRPGQAAQRYPIGEKTAPVTNLFFDAHHSLWASIAIGGATSGLWNFKDGTWRRFNGLNFDSQHLDIWSLLGDRRGSIWIGAAGKGLYRVVDGRVDHFDHTDGLSDDTVGGLFEDREGSIWVATEEGVEQFFDQPITPFTAREGLPHDHALWLASSPDGAVLVSENLSVDKLFPDGSAKSISSASGETGFHFSFVDHLGRAWLGTSTKLLISDGEGSRITNVTDPSLPGGMRVLDMVEDTNHSVWAAGRDWKTPPHGWLWRFEQGRLVQRIESPMEAGHDSIDEIAADSAGGLWVAINRHGLYHLYDGTFRRVTNLAANVQTTQILPVGPGEAWLATASGAVWLKGGSTRVLDAASGLPCDDVFGAASDASGDLWLTTQCDLVKVSAAELHRWREQPGYHVHVSEFGAASGYVGSERSRVMRATDGALWFIGGVPTYRVDPAHIPVNSLEPPLQVQGVQADQRPVSVADQITLPRLTRELEIDYAGLSYLQPDLLTFRYRLLGHDRTWVDAANRRQAFYNDLPPGKYRFQVTACNKDGVCNDKGASISLFIPPAWWQTWWFRALCALSVIAVLAAAIRWRLNAYSKQMRLRFDDRLQERTRVARDLHDTLMQTVLASKMLVDGAADVDSVDKGRAAFEKLSVWLGLAAEEGRAVVDSLRASTAEGRDLAEALELAALEARAGRHNIDTPVLVTGKVRALHPIVRDEVLRIGVEAIRNAFVHSGASHVIVALDYARDLTLRIKDDGQGIDDAVLSSGRSGHFGLVGMRERAELVGATFTITSSPMGTEITLLVPRTVAFNGTLSWSTKFRRLSPRAFKRPLKGRRVGPI